jgi:ribonuclease R
MKKREPNFIIKNTSNKNETLKRPLRSSKKTQKNQMTILGWIDRSQRRHFFIVRPFHKDFDAFIFLKKEELTKHDVGLHTIVRVTLQRDKGNTFNGRIVETFKSMDDVELELSIIQEKHGFPSVFSDQAIREAEESAKFKPGKRTDLTQTVTVTIDGETAKDFDDAISVEENSAGNFNLKVSIADVSHYIREGSKLDEEAYERGTSIYFPGFAIPMLPEQLSNHLCSLVPHEERLTLTCEMEISPRGEVLNSWIYPSVIKSHARLTYTTVSKVVEKGEDRLVSQPISEMLHRAMKLSKIVRQTRKDRGALDLDLPEIEIDVAPDGSVRRIYQSERNEAHRLIEDFMILANEAVSENIEARGYPSIYRVHEFPDPLKMERLKKVIKRWGFTLSEKGDLVDSMQNYLDSVRGHTNEKILITSLLRSLKQAQYSATNVGHFGLGSKSYCHFTSPIRRYPDLMVHRILRSSNFLKDTPKYSEEKLQEIATRCSETERRAFLAERDMEDMKKARYLEPMVGKEFDGVITTVKNFGMFVEMLPDHVDGLIPIRSMPNDFWDVDELETRLHGRRTHKEFWLGDKVRVQLQEVDRLKRQINLRYVAHSGESPKNESSGKKHFDKKHKDKDHKKKKSIRYL